MSMSDRSTETEDCAPESKNVKDPGTDPGGVIASTWDQDLEKQQEAKLTAMYPQANRPMAGHSAFLQKKLAKGQKYFDSGDYQMAKQAGKGKPRAMQPILSVAPEIPTPDSVSTRKTSIVQPSKLAKGD